MTPTHRPRPAGPRSPGFRPPGFRPPGWSRDAIPEDVETARRVLPLHPPSGQNRAICASVLHLVAAPTWPCERYLWARAVLDAADRHEIH